MVEDVGLVGVAGEGELVKGEVGRAHFGDVGVRACDEDVGSKGEWGLFWFKGGFGGLFLFL